MALFHFHVTQIKRSAGQSAVAAAAYRSGEKLHSEYYGEDSDYTRKGGVICSEILLPPQAPPSFSDRETLWNAVEKVERGKRAQLAYSFDIALQNEFSMQENIELARHFLLEQCVSRGMVADYAIHQPDKKDGGIQNPHFHVMCPIRPIEPDGKWGNKQRREYVLDEQGERIRDEAGNYVFNAVPTTDWGKPETLEFWREQWAQLCNTRFAEKGLDCRIDHRSYERQGVEQIPTQHEGPTVRAMEAKGIRTNKGDLNRWIRKTNAMFREAKQKIVALIDWLKEIKAELSKPQPPTLVELLSAYYDNRNKGAYSSKARIANLKRLSEAVSYLETKGLYTADDLDAALHTMQDKIDTLKKSASGKQARIKELDELLRMADYYEDGKPVADKLKTIRFEKSRQKYKAEHDDTLRLFYMAERKLKRQVVDDKLPATAWREEKARLETEYRDLQTELTPLYADVKKLWGIHYNIYEVQHEQERQNAAVRQKKQEIEH
ncbi:MobQ family relaxase [Flavonifractor sp. HCP28S3_F3]|uniref:MobQ family relaxase n=1 Tax=Flavonifractor sp. HCP28S3_F3 TaxID=3438939 RepID=UPI003F8A459C